MIPSMLDQVIAARIPAKRELTATQKRKEAIDEMLAVMRAHGNVTAQRACELMERSPRVCRDWLEELERQGRAYSWKGRPNEPRMWGAVR